MGGRLKLGAAALAMLACLVAGSSAIAAEGDITFCNEFPQKVYVAIAYLQTDFNTWLSRGWLPVDTGKCYIFDTAIRVKTYYYRGESVPYRQGRQRVKTTWGGDKNFAIWENDNFQYYNAEKRVLKSSLVPFTKGAETTGAAITATVTFNADGTVTTVVPAPSQGNGQGSGTEPPGGAGTLAPAPGTGGIGSDSGLPPARPPD